MAIKGNDVIGLKIISIEDGQELATVKDIIYEPKLNRVEGFLIDEKGWFSDAKVVGIGEVKSIGPDAVMVESAAAIKNASEFSQRVAGIAQHNQNLTKTIVMTEDGTELGKITDIYFDQVGGNVSEFEISQGSLKNMASGKLKASVGDVVTVGEDATIVRNYSKADFEAQKEQGGVMGAINKGKEKAGNMYEQGDQAKDKAREAQNMIGEKIKEMRHKFSSKVDEIRVKDALGKYVTVNVLTEDDQIVAKRGDMITHQLINDADQAGVLEKVLNYNAKEPVKS